MRNLIPPLLTTKLLYFSMGLVYFSFHKFRKNIIEGFGLVSSKYTSVCVLLINFGGFFASYFWGFVCDRFQMHKMIMIMTSLLNGGIPLLFLVRECLYQPKGGWEDAKPPTEEMIDEMSSKDFWWTQIFPCTIFILHSLCNVPLPALLDAQALKILISNGYPKEIYGRQRCFSTVAYLTITLAFSIYSPSWSYYDLRKLLIPLLVLGCIYAALVLLLVPSHAEQAELFSAQEGRGVEDKASSKDQPHESPQNVSLWLNAGFMVFILMMFLSGLVRGVMSFYQGTYLTKIAGYTKSQTVIGDLYSTLIEVILFLFGREIIKMLNLYWMMIAGQFFIMLRMFAYFLIPIKPLDPDPGWPQRISSEKENLTWVGYFYLAEILKGMSFGLIHLSGVTIAKDSAYKGQEATAQTIYTGVFANLAGGCSSLLFYATTEKEFKEDPRKRFRWSAWLSLVTLPIMVGVYILRGKILPGFRKWFFPKKSQL